MRWGLAAVRGLAVWVVIGTVVALQVITGPHVIGGAIWLISRIVRPAAVIGVLHGLWVESARGRGPWRIHPVLMGGVTGSAAGLLGVLPACTINGVPMLDPSALAVYIAASVVAGLCAGAALAYAANLANPGENRPVGRWPLLAPFGACVLVGAVEITALGPSIVAHLRPPEITSADVRAIPPGSGRGTALSGAFRVDARDSSTMADWTCFATVVQQDGALSIACEGRHSYKGAVEADGRFRAGGIVVSAGPAGRTVTELELLTGRFVSDSALEITVQAQVAPGLANQTVYWLWRGRGRRCARADMSSCPAPTSGR